VLCQLVCLLVEFQLTGLELFHPLVTVRTTTVIITLVITILGRRRDFFDRDRKRTALMLMSMLMSMFRYSLERRRRRLQETQRRADVVQAEKKQ
jgi:hypothetical protein